MDTHRTDQVAGNPLSSSPLPHWLSKHVTVSYDADDIAALISSIDSSQKAQSSSFQHIPAEIVLHILEYVPIDYILDWRLVCRGFRSAIDGSILYHHLRRAELIGFVGSRDALYMSFLTDEQYDQLHLFRATFLRMDTTDEDQKPRVNVPIWSATHAIFKIDDSWLTAFHDFAEAAKRQNKEDEVTELFLWAVERLQVKLERDSFGNLSWCLKLDHAVLDADIPPNGERSAVRPDLCFGREMTVKVAWKDMLFRFLKTERAFRRMLEEVHPCQLRSFLHTNIETRRNSLSLPSTTSKIVSARYVAISYMPRSTQIKRWIVAGNGRFGSCHHYLGSSEKTIVMISNELRTSPSTRYFFFAEKLPCHPSKSTIFDNSTPTAKTWTVRWIN
tara:strand:+ start:2490 stop:3653 length:1164 start_codon:yes stop_codon:yes gene_type:complete